MGTRPEWRLPVLGTARKMWSSRRAHSLGGLQGGVGQEGSPDRLGVCPAPRHQPCELSSRSLAGFPFVEPLTPRRVCYILQPVDRHLWAELVTPIQETGVSGSPQQCITARTRPGY